MVPMGSAGRVHVGTVCGMNEAVQSQEVKGLLLSLGEQQQLHTCISHAHMLMRGRKTVYHYIQHLYIV
jgi:hypothetical protein